MEIQISLQNTTDSPETLDEGFQLINLTDVMKNATEFRLLVRAHVLDNKGCSGKESNCTYKGKQQVAFPTLSGMIQEK